MNTNSNCEMCQFLVWLLLAQPSLLWPLKPPPPPLPPLTSLAPQPPNLPHSLQCSHRFWHDLFLPISSHLFLPLPPHSFLFQLHEIFLYKFSASSPAQLEFAHRSPLFLTNPLTSVQTPSQSLQFIMLQTTQSNMILKCCQNIIYLHRYLYINIFRYFTIFIGLPHN